MSQVWNYFSWLKYGGKIFFYLPDNTAMSPLVVL